MKSITAAATGLLLLALASICVPSAFAQDPQPAATPSAPIKVSPKATKKGVGTAKIVKGTKNAVREGESNIGKGGRVVGKTANQDSRKVRKSLSQDVRKVQKAVSGQDRKKATPAPAAKP